MPVIIYTGDEKTCRQINLRECPACGGVYEFTEGKYATSITLGDRVHVCLRHGSELTPTEEVCTQTALQKAIAHKNGSVQKDTKFLKKSETMKRLTKRQMEVCVNGL